MGDENEKSLYASAQSSPRRARMATSPARKSNVYEDANSSFSDFEFETSRRFYVDVADDDTETGDPLPDMAFADQLFSNGKVMPLTLKSPPGFQFNNNDIESSFCLSPTAVLKFPFARRSLWNDDFDPFMAALENVKDEKIYRRARCVPPSRPQKLENQIATRGADENVQKGRQVSVPIRVAEAEAKPKGVLLAKRSMLLAKMSNGKPRKECVTVRETKRNKIRRFLFRSASMTMGKCSQIHEHEDKPKDESEALPKPKTNARKLSCSSNSKGLAQYSDVKRVSQALMQYRPKLFPCLGYGSK